MFRFKDFTIKNDKLNPNVKIVKKLVVTTPTLYKSLQPHKLPYVTTESKTRNSNHKEQLDQTRRFSHDLIYLKLIYKC